MTGFTRVVAIGALLGAVACGQSGSAPQGDERAADATALAADPTLAAESASQPARLGIPVSAKPMSRLTAQAADALTGQVRKQA